MLAPSKGNGEWFGLLRGANLESLGLGNYCIMGTIRRERVIMPFITVKVLEGKTVEQKRALVQKMTEVVSETFEVDPSRIFIFFEDMEKDNYGKQGELYSYIDGTRRDNEE